MQPAATEVRQEQSNPVGSMENPMDGRKRSRADPVPVEEDVAESNFMAGRAPKFSRQNHAPSDVKFGTGKVVDANRVNARLKQIQYGKNTIGYDNYAAAVSKKQRGKLSVHPRTPDPYEDVSKRSFDGSIMAWRRSLHRWDNMEDILPVTDGSTAVPIASKKEKKKPEKGDKEMPSDGGDGGGSCLPVGLACGEDSAALDGFDYEQELEEGTGEVVHMKTTGAVDEDDDDDVL
ncbi:histone RNA hairpin-binding protein RNA-binding domain-containing protein [Ochromonadaceae sp. CCMP2298]|nr:histone RNA hairpin-binding protein RNA-binding domain-containing protein [Ochromonadaceae sp. CCMP2298]